MNTKTLSIFIFVGIVFGNMSVNANPQLEQEFLQAINMIESQSSLLQVNKISEAIFLLGNTGCGKSTVFNWLMGGKLRAIKNEKKKPGWLVDVENKDISVSQIGHKLTSETSSPKIGSAQNGVLLVDFPGWDDTRGWQFDLANQYIQLKTLENYHNIKIVFICEYQSFETKRGNGIKEIVSQINHFAQGNMLDKTAMLLITKVYFQDEDGSNWEELKEQYIEGLREDFEEIIKESTTISQQTQQILISLMKNDIYIMKKAGQNKQEYTKQELNQLWRYIDRLESVPLNLLPNMTQVIQSQFQKYFTEQMNFKKESVKFMAMNLKEVYTKNNLTKSYNQKLLDINKEIELFQDQISQDPFNEIAKYNSLETLYLNTMNIVYKDQIKIPQHSRHFGKIYQYFYPLKSYIGAYLTQIFDAQIQKDLFSHQMKFQQNLSRIQLIVNKELEKLARQKEYEENQRKLSEKIQKESLEYRRTMGRIMRFLTNEDRRWWKFWAKSKIPDWVLDEEVEEYLRRENL